MIGIMKLHEDAQIPNLANAGDAGLDLRIIESVTIPPATQATLRTGLAMSIPYGCVGLIWPRSKLAAKFGLDVLAGVVDSGYCGEVMVSLINHGKDPVELRKGDKVAQMIVQSHCSSQTIYESTTFENTERGASGINDSALRLK